MPFRPIPSASHQRRQEGDRRVECCHQERGRETFRAPDERDGPVPLIKPSTHEPSRRHRPSAAGMSGRSLARRPCPWSLRRNGRKTSAPLLADESKKPTRLSTTNPAFSNQLRAGAFTVDPGKGHEWWRASPAQNSCKQHERYSRQAHHPHRRPPSVSRRHQECHVPAPPSCPGHRRN